jgi:hypothetical protein
MTWASLNALGNVAGTQVNQATVGTLGGTLGYPAQAVLNELINKAQNLKLGKSKGGMEFKWARAVAQGNTVTLSDKDGIETKSKNSAAKCHEDDVFPINPGAGHIVIHQSKVPCERCRGSFLGWAAQRPCTIVVRAEEKYDQIPAGAIFLFSPTGNLRIWV